MLTNRFVISANFMKLIISFLLIFQLLTVSLFGGEFAELPALYHHYQKHKAESPIPLDFVTFLAMHYFDNNHIEKDAAHHSLPFQHNNHGENALAKDFQLFTPIKNKYRFSITFLSEKIPYPKEEKLPDPVLRSVFQPPPKNITFSLI